MFEWCNDVDVTRQFYSEVLGLKETFYDGARGWLSYELGEVQLVFMTPPKPLPISEDWAVTPAFTAGSTFSPSWVLEVEPDDFDRVATNIHDAGIATHPGAAEGQPGRLLFIQDPMGKTIEIYSAH